MLNHSFEHKYSTKDSRYRFPPKENSTDASISLSPFYTDSRLEIRDVIVEPNSIHLLVQCCNDHGVCPYCGAVSHKVHSKYCRIIVDLPILGKNVTIHMKSRKFFCPNEECKKKNICRTTWQRSIPLQEKNKTVRNPCRQTRDILLFEQG